MPRLRLVENAGPDQRIKREGRVAKPAIAIVPIARPAELFGQGGRRGRDNAAGLPVRERLQASEASEERPRPNGPLA